MGRFIFDGNDGTLQDNLSKRFKKIEKIAPRRKFFKVATPLVDEAAHVTPTLTPIF